MERPHIFVSQASFNVSKPRTAGDTKNPLGHTASRSLSATLMTFDSSYIRYEVVGM